MQWHIGTRINLNLFGVYFHLHSICLHQSSLLYISSFFVVVFLTFLINTEILQIALTIDRVEDG